MASTVTWEDEAEFWEDFADQADHLSDAGSSSDDAPGQPSLVSLSVEEIQRLRGLKKNKIKFDEYYSKLMRDREENPDDYVKRQREYRRAQRQRITAWNREQGRTPKKRPVPPKKRRKPRKTKAKTKRRRKSTSPEPERAIVSEPTWVDLPTLPPFPIAPANSPESSPSPSESKPSLKLPGVPDSDDEGALPSVVNTRLIAVSTPEPVSGGDLSLGLVHYGPADNTCVLFRSDNRETEWMPQKYRGRVQKVLTRHSDGTCTFLLCWPTHLWRERDHVRSQDTVQLRGYLPAESPLITYTWVQWRHGEWAYMVDYERVHTMDTVRDVWRGFAKPRGVQKRRGCSVCGGTQQCEHGRKRFKCKICLLAANCEHREKYEPIQRYLDIAETMETNMKTWVLAHYDEFLAPWERPGFTGRPPVAVLEEAERLAARVGNPEVKIAVTDPLHNKHICDLLETLDVDCPPSMLIDDTIIPYEFQRQPQFRDWFLHNYYQPDEFFVLARMFPPAHVFELNIDARRHVLNLCGDGRETLFMPYMLPPMPVQLYETARRTATQSMNGTNVYKEADLEMEFALVRRGVELDTKWRTHGSFEIDIENDVQQWLEHVEWSEWPVVYPATREYDLQQLFMWTGDDEDFYRHAPEYNRSIIANLSPNVSDTMPKTRLDVEMFARHARQQQLFSSLHESRLAIVIRNGDMASLRTTAPLVSAFFASRYCALLRPGHGKPVGVSERVPPFLLAVEDLHAWTLAELHRIVAETVQRWPRLSRHVVVTWNNRAKWTDPALARVALRCTNRYLF